MKYSDEALSAFVAAIKLRNPGAVERTATRLEGVMTPETLVRLAINPAFAVTGADLHFILEYLWRDDYPPMQVYVIRTLMRFRDGGRLSDVQFAEALVGLYPVMRGPVS